MTKKGDMYEVQYGYITDDGRSFLLAPKTIESSDIVLDKMVEYEAEMLSQIKNIDAREAVRLGIDTAYKEATIEQVQYAWLKTGYDSLEHWKAYQLMKPIAPSLLALGLTDEEYADLLNTTVADAVASREYWTFLEGHKDVLDAYAEIAEIEV